MSQSRNTQMEHYLLPGVPEEGLDERDEIQLGGDRTHGGGHDRLELFPGRSEAQKLLVNSSGQAF